MLAGAFDLLGEATVNTYIAYVYKDPNSSFGVSFPDLPGCYGAGETYNEALENAKISLREYAAALADDGDDMPKPRTYDELSSDVTVAMEFDKAAFVIEVPLVTFGSKRRVNVSLDNGLLSAIDRACELAGVNRSSFLSKLAVTWLEDTLGAVTAPKKTLKRGTSKRSKNALALEPA